MYTIFLTTIINEITGLLPITAIQIGYALIDQSMLNQIIIAFAFSVGSLTSYFIGKYGGIPLLIFFNRKKAIPKKGPEVRANFFWILIMRAIPFFPAKYVSIGLGILKYNLILFFISSFIGILLRGMIIVYLYKIGLMSIELFNFK